MNLLMLHHIIKLKICDGTGREGWIESRETTQRVYFNSMHLAEASRRGLTMILFLWQQIQPHCGVALPSRAIKYILFLRYKLQPYVDYCIQLGKVRF